MSPSTAKEFLLTTDYPIDQVVYKTSTSASVPTAANFGDYTTITIAHGLPFTPLCFGTYSDDNFATSYEFGNYDLFYNSTYAQYTIRTSAVVESDATNIYIMAQNMQSTKTFYFHVVALAPTTVAPGTEAPATSVNPGFVLNTDHNYMKVYMSGTLAHADDGFSGFETETISHNLGYVPNAMVWSEIGGRMRMAGAEMDPGGTYGVDSEVYLTTSDLVIETDPLSTDPVTYHYRIYLDD